MNIEFIEALDQIEKEKGIKKEILLDAIEAAVTSAYKRNFGSAQNVKITIDRQTGEVKVYSIKNVVENVESDLLEISLEDAREIDDNYELGDVMEEAVRPKKFGRIAAQTAKQVVVQRIREAERDIIFDLYVNRQDEIITGIVQRKERSNVFVDLGRIEAILGPNEQMPGEIYNHGDRIKLYIVEVKKTTKGPQILVSRTHPGLVKRLFELEVPEIYDGIVEIYSISREAGSRTKIAVYSHNEDIDPVGACVGHKGSRVQQIVDELRGEKIDIIKWSDDPRVYISSALSPAKVLSVDVNETEKAAKVVVEDYQLSLAIGKEGQNVRLAAKLTGWKIDIKSKSQAELPIGLEENVLKEDTITD